jgi:hypothetical protein
VDLAARNGDAAMVRYRECYLELTPQERRSHLPEEICERAGVAAGELMGAVCRAIWECGAAESSMLCAMAQPEVLERTVKLAKESEHFKDRELFFRLTGSLPDKGGTSINIVNQTMAATGAPAANGKVFSGTLKSFDEEIIEMSQLLDGAFQVKNGEDEQ